MEERILTVDEKLYNIYEELLNLDDELETFPSMVAEGKAKLNLGDIITLCGTYLKR